MMMDVTTMSAGMIVAMGIYPQSNSALDLSCG
jgi:hypothetical protein